MNAEAEDTAVSNLETEDHPIHKPSPKRSVVTVSRYVHICTVIYASGSVAMQFIHLMLSALGV